MGNRGYAVLFGCAVAFAGCDAAPIPEPVVLVGPHQGTMIRLTDGKGFVELTNEPPVTNRSSTESTSLVAYFLQPDGKSALEPAPTDVQFIVDQGRARKKGDVSAVALSADAKPDDPAGSGRFASKPGRYQLTALRGRLSAKLAGQEVSTQFEGSR
jgi:hypothetical protein